ncbi:MAG: PfkB domain protein [Planctomycetota bacterium]|nr:PfkB domain protein [Planctomycetota bacterium]
MARDAVIDVLGLGIVTVDDLLYVPAYPLPDAKERVRLRLRQCGGLTGTALVAAARLGAKAAYAGCLDDGELSNFIRANFRSEGIDVNHVDPLRQSRPIHSTIIVDESGGTRTILFELPENTPFGGDWPADDVVRSARVLFIDHYDADRTIRAAKIARADDIPVVADFERDEGPRFDELNSVASHLILSRNFATKITGEIDPIGMVKALWSLDRDTVVVTCGDQGCWFATRAELSPIHRPAFAVEIVDTTGCGDVFHGAYAASLARGEPINRRIAVASAAAAIKATRPGGQAGIPTLKAVEAFLKGTS